MNQRDKVIQEARSTKAIRYLANVMAISASAADAHEEITAFFEKREPRFAHR